VLVLHKLLPEVEVSNDKNKTNEDGSDRGEQMEY
jgi:hypothetical protein